MTGRTAPFFLAFLLVVPDGLGQSFLSQPDQRFFAEDDRAFKYALPLTADVVSVMLRSSMAEADVKQLLEATPQPGRPGLLFSATPVKLSDAGDRWLLAVGTSPATSGADNGHFWLVDLSKPTPHAIMLAPANYVKLLDTTHAGHRDVETQWCSPNECIYGEYRFIRGRYHKFRERDIARVQH